MKMIINTVAGGSGEGGAKGAINLNLRIVSWDSTNSYVRLSLSAYVNMTRGSLIGSKRYYQSLTAGDSWGISQDDVVYKYTSRSSNQNSAYVFKYNDIYITATALSSYYDSSAQNNSDIMPYAYTPYSSSSKPGYCYNYTVDSVKLDTNYKGTVKLIGSVANRVTTTPIELLIDTTAQISGGYYPVTNGAICDIYDGGSTLTLQPFTVNSIEFL